jgi:hypothetical protein
MEHLAARADLFEEGDGIEPGFQELGLKAPTWPLRRSTCYWLESHRSRASG